MRRLRLVLFCSLAALGSSTRAVRADMVAPPPAECPAGTKATTGHAGPHCAPRTCETSEQCADGLECTVLRLCVAERQYRSMGGPGTTSVIEGPCPDGMCASGQCRSLRVCAPPGTGTGGAEAQGVEARLGRAGGQAEEPQANEGVQAEDAAEQEDEIEETEEPEEFAEPSDRARRPDPGCSPRWTSGAILGVVLGIFAVVLILRRRRG